MSETAYADMTQPPEFPDLMLALILIVVAVVWLSGFGS